MVLQYFQGRFINSSPEFSGTEKLTLLEEVSRMHEHSFFFSAVVKSDFITRSAFSANRPGASLKAPEGKSLMDGRISFEADGIAGLQLLKVSAEGNFAFFAVPFLVHMAGFPHRCSDTLDHSRLILGVIYKYLGLKPSLIK
jgi:hypothetical protein